MIEIKKGKEPAKLLAYRKRIGSSYEQMDSDVKADLMRSLLEEQGHLCAYCMRKIPEKRKLPYGVPTVTIEHWIPRNPEDNGAAGKELDYHNMFAVCAGNRGCGNKEWMTCDARKGNKRIKVNPCDVNTLIGISYTSNGIIISDNQEINEDINEKLNLNCSSVSLPENRKNVLQTFIEDVSKKCGDGDISSYCEKKLKEFRAKNDPQVPFVGIIIWWLEKHIKN